ncbi:MFS transporter [Streptomyces nanshensis]|uniref:MFS transporter n=1 Tax=Streptomyces nanshensis TaxID=518642 RepID=A0A1E7L9C4_9ACTN|nr:MFS transporter [Streptomyces nanshensis]OEV12809.1 MFS transporter [Streptomyces nanshensis]
MFKGPLAGRYPVVSAMVVFALVPYLALSAALGPITPIIADDLDMSLRTLNVTTGLANAGYAVGTILAVQFAQHLPQRRMLIIYGSLLVIGSVLTASAVNAGIFVVGHIVQGLCTSLLLIAAVPPLITGYPQARLRETVVILNMCIFGAVALGPVFAGIQANSNGWRPLFWVVAGIATAALVLSVLTFEYTPPASKGTSIDFVALGLASVGCVAGFFGASQLLTHSFSEVRAWAPLIGGLLLIVILFIHEYTAKHPLLCVRSLFSTFPVAGIVAAMCAAAASVSATLLTSTVLAERMSPLRLGLLYLPEVGGAVIAAVAFGRVFRTRLLHFYVLGGLTFLSVGIAVMNAAEPPTAPLIAVGSGLVGVGVGSSVVPALFIAGFSLRSNQVQRVFGIVELMRAVAAFMIGPILMYIATTAESNLVSGTRDALWICFGLGVAGAVLGAALYVVGGVRHPPKPSVQGWMSGEQPGWDSPPLFAGLTRSEGGNEKDANC